MSYLRDTVYVLRVEPYREHDAWVTMYGRTHGKLAAVARGLLRPGAKHAGHVEPFACIEVMIAKGSAFDKLAIARTVKPNDTRLQLSSLAVAGAFCDAFERLTREGVSDPVLYDLLDKTLTFAAELPEEATPERIRLVHSAAMLKLLDQLGFGPDFNDVPSDLGKLLRFMRSQNFSDLLRLTAPSSLFTRASLRVRDACSATPLEREPLVPVF